jgi:hypothetical protein
MVLVPCLFLYLIFSVLVLQSKKICHLVLKCGGFHWNIYTPILVRIEQGNRYFTIGLHISPCIQSLKTNWQRLRRKINCIFYVQRMFFICIRTFETIKHKWVNMSEMYAMHTLLKLLFICKKIMASHYF